MTKKAHEGNRKIFIFSGIGDNFGHPNASRAAAPQVNKGRAQTQKSGRADPLIDLPPKLLASC